MSNLASLCPVKSLNSETAVAKIAVCHEGGTEFVAAPFDSAEGLLALPTWVLAQDRDTCLRYQVLPSSTFLKMLDASPTMFCY